MASLMKRWALIAQEMAVFLFFYFRFLQKYIFVFKIYRNIPRPPGSGAAGTWSPRCGAAGAFLQKFSRRICAEAPGGPVARQRSDRPPRPPGSGAAGSFDNSEASFDDFTRLFVTPVQDNDPSLHTPLAQLRRPTRDVRPPDRHSYPTYHVHAQRKRGRMVGVISRWHLFLYCYYGLFRLFGLWLFMIVVVLLVICFYRYY